MSLTEVLNAWKYGSSTPNEVKTSAKVRFPLFFNKSNKYLFPRFVSDYTHREADVICSVRTSRKFIETRLNFSVKFNNDELKEGKANGKRHGLAGTQMEWGRPEHHFTEKRKC